MTVRTDPVCGMEVAAKRAAGHAEYRGATYYFCSPGCQAKFQAHPVASAQRRHWLKSSS